MLMSLLRVCDYCAIGLGANKKNEQIVSARQLLKILLQQMGIMSLLNLLMNAVHVLPSQNRMFV